MSGIQGVGRLDSQFQDLPDLEGLGADAVLQYLPRQQFHGVKPAAPVPVDTVDGADVGMIDGGGGLRLALAALRRRMIPEYFFKQEPERNEATELGVVSLVDDTHPSAPELLLDALVGQTCADHTTKPRLP